MSAPSPLDPVPFGSRVHPGRMRRRLPLLVAVIIAAASVSIVAAGSGAAATTSAPSAPTLEGPRFADRNRELDAEQKKRDDARNTPEAKEERASSRRKHAGQRRDDAAALARERFPGPLTSRILDGARPLPGHRVVKFFDGNSAEALDAKDRRTVVESLAPLAVKRDGKWNALNLSMRRDGTSFVPTNAAVPFKVAEKPTEGVAFPRAGFAFHVVGAGAGEAPTSS